MGMLSKREEKKKQAGILKEKPVLFYSKFFVSGMMKPIERYPGLK